MEFLWSDLPEQNGQPDHGTVALDAVRPNESTYASSISFSSPGRSEPDSDFATDRAGTKAGHRKPGSSDDDFSDDSTYGAAKRWHTVFAFAALEQPSTLEAYCLRV